MYKSAIEAHYSATKIHIDNIRIAKGKKATESVYVDPPFNTQLLNNYPMPELIPIDQLNGY
jgi:16S rRNA G966 N2-methylase RsmD